MIFLIFWLIGIITTIMNPTIRTVQAISTNLLFYQLVITLTLTGVQGFLGHVFKSDMVAEYIGWEKGSPFQKELGYAELGYGIAGVLCIWMGREFWLAVIVIISPLFIGAAIVHLKEMMKNKNFKTGNSTILLPDLIIPLSLISLYFISVF
ncbi:DUF6790 family protein [Clostridium weizhouense]|uniref:Uncharacterized protein n=1 Tax=Clostridium weizhouense TaxID=2859781 RepID=A0ABS7AS85_9CLOT|nr:DUF6790 family protein [Clostridium weizhouense]MBW6411524.1 hypothetical protein [Clostridium weizhouense]